MGMTGVFKWLRKDMIQRDRTRQSLPPKLSGFNNDAYRTALQAFLARRKNPTDPGYIVSPNTTDTTGFDYIIKNNNDNEKSRDNIDNFDIPLCGVPHTQLSEIFEIGWVAGTEDRYIELIYAEWQNTKVSLRKHINRECRDAVKADIKVLLEVRHPNVLLLMGTTQTVDNHLVGIFEPVDCTLYHFIHEQSERMPIQGIAKCAGNLTGALKYAHMRGYIHTAVSSHCVFLTSNGVVKLGGWELAIDSNKPHTESKKYEERLRSEIYKWQAPEIFTGNKATVASDVYSLTLLMWEMCTTNVPWSDLTKEDLEKQYTQLKQRIAITAYNFPALLNNLLEAGLQLDVNKRTLDMMKMARFLQRLEMQYEDKDPIYVDRRSIISTDSQNNTRLSGLSEREPSTVPLPSLTSNSTLDNSDSSPLNVRQIETKQKIEPRKLFPKTRAINYNHNTKNLANKNAKSVEKSSSDLKQDIKQLPKISEQEKNVDLTQESDNNPRIDMKKLKEVLANRRRSFFCGPDLPQNLQSPAKIESLKTSTLQQIKSKDYEPHKPASHKTSMEPKVGSSPHNSTFTRPSKPVTPKSPYSYVPTTVRNAVVQPQVLNSTSQSFFESSLWSKERSICLSKSRNDDLELSESNNKHSSSPGSDKTFTINDSKMDGLRDKSRNVVDQTSNETAADMTISTIPRCSSLQALKDTLERVTNLVKLNSSHSPPSFESSPIKNSITKSNIDHDIQKTRESVFEELYNLNDGVDEKIKTIERSTSQRYFKVDLRKITEPDPADEIFRDDLQYDFGQKRPTPTLVELKTALECGRPIFRSVKSTGEYKLTGQHVIDSHISALNGEKNSVNDKFVISTEDENKLNFLDFGKKNDEDFSAHSEIFLSRRRSLPTGLGVLRKGGETSSLAKLSIKGITLPDSTVEEFYIDDEFSDNSLAPNMILLDKDSTAGSHDMFPELIDEDY